MENSTIDTQATESKIATLLENARQAISTGDYTGAGRYADEVLTLNEEHGNAYYWKGAALFGQKKYKKAVSSLTEAVVLYEFNIDYFSLLALAYFKTAQAEKAVLVADRGLALQADDLACLEVKTLSLIALFRLQEAHVVLQQVLLLKAKGVVSKQAAFVTDDVEALYEQALTIDPFKTKSRLDNFNTIKLRNADSPHHTKGNAGREIKDLFRPSCTHLPDHGNNLFLSRRCHLQVVLVFTIYNVVARSGQGRPCERCHKLQIPFQERFRLCIPEIRSLPYHKRYHIIPRNLCRSFLLAYRSFVGGACGGLHFRRCLFPAR